MIPKTIHYCWFGGNPLPEDAQKCIASWKKYCPDYEIKEWNETNFDINYMPFVKQAYESGKFAFVSDIARLIALYNEGGVYMDTDVELLKPLDELLENTAYIGFENNEFVNSGQGFGSQAGTDFLKEHIDVYKKEKFINEDGTFNIIKCTAVTTDLLLAKGLEQNGKKQTVGDMMVYPADYFNPYDDATGRLHKTENTYSIHWYAKTWISQNRFKARLMQIIHRLFGTERVHNLAKKVGLR